MCQKCTFDPFQQLVAAPFVCKTSLHTLNGLYRFSITRQRLWKIKVDLITILADLVTKNQFHPYMFLQGHSVFPPTSFLSLCPSQTRSSRDVPVSTRLSQSPSPSPLDTKKKRQPTYLSSFTSINLLPLDSHRLTLCACDNSVHCPSSSY